jgi:hypothetical protein
MIETGLNGQFPPDFVAQERVNLSRLWASGQGRPPSFPPTRIADARPLQARAPSQADCLAEHGFVLLDAPTSVTDWDDADQISRLYLPDIEALIRARLYPGRKLRVMQVPRIVRRGAGTDNPHYGAGVHQDYGTSAEDYQHSLEAFAGAQIAAQWRAGFEHGGVEGFVVLDFWRTTNMAGPLAHMPLALCDPSSVDPADIVPTALEGIAPGGGVTHHIGLRHNPGQLWYYYPAMMPNELLVFKLFQLMRDEEPQRYRACFHSAVEDPSAAPDPQPRQSCEHRVAVMLLR